MLRRGGLLVIRMAPQRKKLGGPRYCTLLLRPYRIQTCLTVWTFVMGPSRIVALFLVGRPRFGSRLRAQKIFESTFWKGAASPLLYLHSDNDAIKTTLLAVVVSQRAV